MALATVASAEPPSRRSGDGRAPSISRVFDITKYGANGDDANSDQTALEAAVAAAAATSPVGTVLIPRGHYYQTRPIYLPPSMSVDGDGIVNTLIDTAGMGWSGYNFIVGADHGSAGLNDWPTLTTRLKGSAGYALAQNPNNTGAPHVWYDLTQYSGMRFPHAAWTVDLFLRLDGVPIDDTIVTQVAGSLVGGADGMHDFGTEYEVAGTAWDLKVDSNRQLKWQLRADGCLSLPFTINTATYTALTVGTIYHIELSWNGTTMRAFINGERWTQGGGAQAPGTACSGGTRDSSGFVHHPWERWLIGNCSGGVFPGDCINANAFSTIDSIKVSDNEQHSSTFTPPTIKHTADSHTILLVNFDSFYKDNIIAAGGANGTTAVYLRAGTNPTCVDTPNVSLRDFYMLGGAGVWGEFSENMTVENVFHLYPTDGWVFQCNGFFSKFSNVKLIAGTGRFAMQFMGGASYIGLDNVVLSAPGGGLVANSSNIHGSNINVSVHPGTYAGVVLNGSGGTSTFNGLQMDAEEASTVGFIGAMIIDDQASTTCVGCTLYGFANTVSPVVVSHIAEPTSIAFESPYMLTSASTAFIKLIGALKTFAKPIVISNPLNTNGSPLMSPLASVAMMNPARALMSHRAAPGGSEFGAVVMDGGTNTVTFSTPFYDTPWSCLIQPPAVISAKTDGGFTASSVGGGSKDWACFGPAGDLR